MEKTILRKLMLIAVLLTGSNVFAHDFEAQNSDGVTIYYNIISATDLTCEVTYRGGSSSEYSGEYTGDVVIPTSVTNGENTYSVTSIGDYAFSSCSGLTSITIPNSVTSIGSSAFYGCTGLTSVSIGNSVTSIGESAFYGCSGLTSVYINDLEAWCKIDFGSFEANPLYCADELYLNNKLVTKIEIPNTITIIKKYAFCEYEYLFSITIPNSVTSIGNSAFSDCSGLTSVTIPNSVTNIGAGAFSGCN